LHEVNSQLRSHPHHQQAPIQIIPWVPILNALTEPEVGLVYADQRILGSIPIRIELLRTEEVREDAIEKDRENFTDKDARVLDDLLPNLYEVDSVGEGALLLLLEDLHCRKDALLEEWEQQPVHGCLEYSVHPNSSV
jgi:hypothetical protein